MMKVLIAPDSFKGSLSAEKAAEAMKLGVLATDKSAECITMPLADGGEGMIESISTAVKAKIIKTRVQNPIGKEIETEFAVSVDGKTAFIEMAKASGLCLIDKKDQNPMITSTYGTGQQIKTAISMGCKTIYIGAGGSATCDGGIGMAISMGYKFLDEKNLELKGIGQSLTRIKSIDCSNAIKTNAKIIVMCDVTNPFYGENSAAKIFAPQKGANKHETETLDKGLKNLSEVIKRDLGIDISDIPGAGAAGGFAGGVLAFLKGELAGGFDSIAKILNIEEHIKHCDLVLTGEGKTDAQTAMGKVVLGIGRLAKKHDTPCICISGSVDEEAKVLYQNGITAMFGITNKPMTLEYAMENAFGLLKNETENIIRICKI